MNLLFYGLLIGFVGGAVLGFYRASIWKKKLNEVKQDVVSVFNKVEATGVHIETDAKASALKGVTAVKEELDRLYMKL